MLEDQSASTDAPLQEFLPFAQPLIGEEEIAEVVDTLRSGWLTTGPKVQRFEAEFAAHSRCSHAIAVNSCTAGLHCTLAAIGIQPGDEVIVPTLTFCSTANTVTHLGATPVLVDIGEDLNVSPEAIEAAITSRTKAIMPVHFAGQSCDLDAIFQIAAERGLDVVVDAAHAAGSTYLDAPVASDQLLERLQPNGDLRVASVFSFYATKNLTTGEGGMVATRDPALAERIRLLVLHGMSRDAWARYTRGGSWSYEVVAPGYKYNMMDLQAALGIHQLAKLDGFTRARRRYARIYDEAFADLDEVSVPIQRPDRLHVYHLYAIQLDTHRLSIDRAEFIEALRDRNIGTSVHFIPVHLHEYYRKTFGYRPGQLPVAESAFEGLVSLPLYPRMTPEQVEHVALHVRYIVHESRR